MGAINFTITMNSRPCHKGDVLQAPITISSVGKKQDAAFYGDSHLTSLVNQLLGKGWWFSQDPEPRDLYPRRGDGGTKAALYACRGLVYDIGHRSDASILYPGV